MLFGSKALVGKERDALVYRAAFLIVHFYPVRDFIEGAQTAAAHVIAQHRGAVADTRTVCGRGLVSAFLVSILARVREITSDLGIVS